MIEKDLIKTIFYEPIMNGADTLCIISGYAAPNMASWLLKYIDELDFKIKKPIDIILIVGMTSKGISLTAHEGFKNLVLNTFTNKVNSFSCQYIYQNKPVHTKMYIWLKDNVPFAAYIGSADFIQSSFSGSTREVMVKCSPDTAFEYFNKVEADSIYCSHAEIEEYIQIFADDEIFDENNNLIKDMSADNISSVTLSLLDSRTGRTHTAGGLNWGQRVNRYTLKDGSISERSRNPNEAYIPLPKKIASNGFFPLNKQHFTVITDDNHQLILRVEQQGDKAITTPQSNALLGEYFRNRLHLQNGEYITLEHLKRHGRTDVTFYKLDDEHFYMDFSTEKQIGDL